MVSKLSFFFFSKQALTYLNEMEGGNRLKSPWVKLPLEKGIYGKSNREGKPNY